MLTCVGVIVVMSSSLKDLRIVVLPALSRPRTRMRACGEAHEGQHRLCSAATEGMAPTCRTSPSFFFSPRMSDKRPCK